MSPNWRNYQEEAAEFFRGLGMTAETDMSLRGVRTSHDVDVVVRTEYAGFAILWVVECKHWQTPVSKLHVLGLREIVSDLGADRGILLAEGGFQSGALEAAHLTNVQLTSLAELRLAAEAQIYAMRLIELYDRVQDMRARYWALDKQDRINYGLRPEVGVYGYSSERVSALSEDLLKKAMRGIYPIETDKLLRLAFKLPDTFASVGEVYHLLLPLVEELEAKLTHAEQAVKARAES